MNSVNRELGEMLLKAMNEESEREREREETVRPSSRERTQIEI